MIIGIAGEAGSGKDTAANVLVEEGYERGRFANALKEMLRALLRYRGVDAETIERMIDGDLKELPTPLLSGRSPRHVMQGLGEWGRVCIKEDFWIDVEFAAKRDAKKLLFADLRYDNEEEAIVKRGGLVVQMVGRGGIDSDHISEKFKPKNPTVIDNSGTVAELKQKMKQLSSDLSWAA